EAEIGIGITVILTAASLTSLPPAADLTRDRVSGTEIFTRMVPRPPRLGSPSMQELPEEVYAAQQRAFESGSLSTESYVPGQAGTRPNKEHSNPPRSPPNPTSPPSLPRPRTPPPKKPGRSTTITGPASLFSRLD